MKNTLQEEQAYYDTHKSELVRDYLGKQVVIYQNKVQGAFDTVSDAFDYALDNKFTPGRFMIKKVVKNEPIYYVIPTIIQVGGDE